MRDTPQKFFKDVVRADEGYATGMDTDLLLGNMRVTDFAGIPEDKAKRVIGPFVDGFMDQIRGHIPPLSRELEKLVDDPPKCIMDRDIYQGLHYMTDVEVPYALSLIEHTHLKNHVDIPYGTDEFVRKLSSIPLCDDAYYPNLHKYA